MPDHRSRTEPPTLAGERDRLARSPIGVILCDRDRITCIHRTSRVIDPDERSEPEAIYASRDRVFLRVVERGTFLKPWTLPDGIVAPPTGRPYRADSVLGFRIAANGLIAGHYQYTTLGFQQIGLTPQAIAGILRTGL